MPNRTRRFSAEVVVEAHGQPIDDLRDWAMERVRGSTKFVRRGAIGIVIYDEDGKPVRASLDGTPSPELQKEFGGLLKEDS